MKKVLILIPFLLLFLLVGCTAKDEFIDVKDEFIDVKVVGHKEQVVIIDKKKETVYYLEVVIVGTEQPVYLLEVKKELFTRIEDSYAIDSILNVNKKELIQK